ncbi:MAG: peptidylprolyl isomerase [Flavobacteriales bacterium]|nr:MAG: peptidylprolyl isomerase [Flavobacteriales bacterium]
MTKKIFPVILALITICNINGLAQKSEKQTKILISTSYGDMKMVLYNETPKHRDNFIKLVQKEFYNGTLFHRVIKDFMIQGGDPESKGAQPGQMLGSGGPGYTVPAEFNTKFIHKKGALSAARQGDNVNPKKESSGSQFYIVQGKKSTKMELTNISKRNGITYTGEQVAAYETIGGTPFLDMNYTVFGEIIEGMDVIDKIAAVVKGRGDRPKEDIKMTMKIVKK